MYMSVVERSTASLPAPAGAVWTFSDLYRLPDDGRRYEVLHGELLVSPPPSFGHQNAVTALVVAISNWCTQHTKWSVVGPGGFCVSETTWLEPDVAVFPVSRSAELTWQNAPVPVLVVEVLSPSTRNRDRHRKRAAYLAHGVGEVWLLDMQERTVERWTSASEFPELHREEITWTPVTSAPPLHITNDALFGASAG